MNQGFDRNNLERLYRQYNRREYVHPDPLEFLYDYSNPQDQEIVGLIASSLAYGRVAQILKSVSCVLNLLTPSPSLFLKDASFNDLQNMFTGFKHRFATGNHISDMLIGTKQAIEKYGSLYTCFVAGFKENDETILPALSFFVRKITDDGNLEPGHLLPLPEKGSACKRMNLFLRWMIRQDDVDPGRWKDISQSKLIIPLDTHMHRIALKAGLTSRKQTGIKTALEITSGFKKIIPEDPVRYDFVLTRIGIRDDIDTGDLF